MPWVICGRRIAARVEKKTDGQAGSGRAEDTKTFIGSDQTGLNMRLNSLQTKLEVRHRWFGDV